MSEKKALRFAIVGCGGIGDVHAQVIRQLDDAVLSAVCDVNQEAGLRMAQKYHCRYEPNFQILLQDEKIDAVSVCLPSGLHYQAVVDCARAGKHVMVEKPIDTDWVRAKEMVRICNERNVVFSVILQHRFDPAVMALKNVQERGGFGRLLWGSAKTIWYREESYYQESSWRGTWSLDGGGALMNQSIHMIDLLLYFMGIPQKVSGHCKTLLHQIETEDLGLATVTFHQGALGTIEGTTLAYPGFYSELALYGEKGSAVIRNDQLIFYRFQSGSDPVLDRILQTGYETYGTNAPTVKIDSHRKQYRDFTKAVIEKRKPMVTGEDGIKSIKLIHDIYRSSKLGLEIQV